MKQLVDITNTLTSEQIRNSEKMIHHNRSQSVKRNGDCSASGVARAAAVHKIQSQEISRVASMPNTGVEDEYYRLRHFAVKGKGVINRGDSFKCRRSRSNNSVTSSNSSTERLTIVPVQASFTVSKNGFMRRESSDTSAIVAPPAPERFKVLILGGTSVGKTSIVSQFMTSEYLHAHDSNVDEETGEKSVSVLLGGEESELIFMDHPHAGIMPEMCIATYDANAYCVMYSTTDRKSFMMAESILQTLWQTANIEQKAVILVGNKSDLARKRVVSTDEGKSKAITYDCKFIETSVTINHNVDELLVGILAQIRLKLDNPEKTREILRKRSIAATADITAMLAATAITGSTNHGHKSSGPRKYRGSKTSISFKVKGFFDRIWVRDAETKSCQNLHVL